MILTRTSGLTRAAISLDAQYDREEQNFAMLKISSIVEKSMLLRSQKYVYHLKRFDIGEDMVNDSFLV